MFSARQRKAESIASWRTKIDEMETDLREAARRVCKPDEILGAIGLINHLGKACFIQGLFNELTIPSFEVEESRSSYLTP
jgi:hypothetical protein